MLYKIGTGFDSIQNAMETTTEDYFTIYRPNTEQLWEVATAVSVQAILLVFQLKVVYTF